MKAVHRSVGAVIVDECNRVLLQKRDSIDSIWFPGFWGVFGGGCDVGEDSERALYREIMEELKVQLQDYEFFLKWRFNCPSLGGGERERTFYIVKFSRDMVNSIELSEGADYKFFSIRDMPSPLDVVPFDLAALTLWANNKFIDRSLSPFLLSSVNAADDHQKGHPLFLSRPEALPPASELLSLE